ncbi:MAG: arylsulfatase, partial [Bacteroidales bacterium]|nr:arylsulfatase [Bacteroidales bacterium]
KFPDTFKGKNTIPPEGISLLPALEGKQLPRRTLYWEHEGNKAIREGKWKLVMEYPGEWNRKAKYMGIWELYDMEKDRTEIHNLADKYPKKVNEMSKKWEKWAKRCNVQPWEEIVKKQK